MPTKQQPPHPGWKFDEDSRGWYAPRYRSFFEAKARGTQETQEQSSGVGWISRRLYDEKYGRAKGSTYERIARERKTLRVPPDWHQIVNYSHGERHRTAWYTHSLRDLHDINVQIANLKPNQRIIVVAYGKPSRYYTYEDEQKARNVYRTVLKATLAGSFRQDFLKLASMGSVERYELKAEFL